MSDGTRRTGAFAWLVTLVVPPVMAGALGQRFIAQHAVLAVVIVGAYEAAVAVAGFFAVIARDVSSRWQTRLADRVDLFLQRTGPRFERRYRRFVMDWLRFTDTKGLAIVGPFTPELDAVFVDVSLVPRPPQQISPGILPDIDGDRTARHTLDHFLGRAERVVLAVVGAPGSGKTTLLRNAARRASELRRSRWGRRSRARDIPVLLCLRDHVAAIMADPAVSVADLLRTTPGLAVKDEPPGWFERQLMDGRCLVLLDGLDEVSRAEDRTRVSEWAAVQVRQYSRSSFVISSRPRGYQSAPVEGADIVQVCGFTTSQVEAFVRRWYRAVERRATGTSGPEADALAAEGAGDLLQRLGQAPALYDLAVNPLLLTMIVNVHRYRSALPGSRADLYSEICQVMLWRRQVAKHVPLEVSGDKSEAILEALAYAMMMRRVSDLSHADVLAEAQPFLRRGSRGVTADSFLAAVSSSGLLIERETGQYAFAHKTLQEYLAAAHIRKQGLISVLANSVSDDWWAETTLLYTAKSNADPIIRACLEAGTAPALALALDCTDPDTGQDSDVDPRLREQLDATIVIDADPAADPERRRLLAATMLRRHVRQRIRTSETSHICLQPVTSAIYRLFLADTMTPEPDAPLTEASIATGMRSSDAAAFARWANDVSGIEQAYRLPLAAELSELAEQHPVPALASGQPPCIWTQTGSPRSESNPVLWLAPGARDPHEISKDLLASALAEDAKRSAPALGGLLLLRARLIICALNLALDRVRDLDNALDLSLARELARSLDQALDREWDRAFDRTLDARALAVARKLAQERERERELIQAPARALAQARELARASERDLTEARSQISELTRARERARSRARDSERELTQARVQARNRERELTQPPPEARDSAQAREHARQLADARAQARSRESELTRTRDSARAEARDRDGEIETARNRERILTRARDRALAHVRECALALDVAEASERDHITALVLEFDRARVLAQAPAFSHALAFDNALVCNFVGDRNLDLVRDYDLARDLARDRDLAHTVRDSIFDLAIGISEAAGRHKLWRSLSEPALSAFDGAFGHLLGEFLSTRLMKERVPAGKSPVRGLAAWAAVLAEELARAAGGGSAGSAAVDPAKLEAALDEAVKSLPGNPEEPGTISLPSSWPAIVAERLGRSAGPVFARAERLTTGNATACRLAALCLASEADAMMRTEVGEMFRQIAAGITLLENRADLSSASEVIMLAVEQTQFNTPVKLSS